MPFPLKIQPIDSNGAIRADQAKPVVKSRLKRLFERQFPGVLRISSSDKLAGAGDAKERDRDGAGDIEPSSVVLDKMVQSFMEDSNDKSSKNHRCNCFQGNCDDSSDDELQFAGSAASYGDVPVLITADAGDILKGLIVCASVAERNLAADASSIVEKIKNSKGKEESLKILTDGLQSLGYNVAVCKSHWEKSSSYPAGEHEYIDVIIDGDRILIDVDFRSEFEIARSTKSYRALLQSLPLVFVGTADRVSQIVAVVSEAAKQSLKKKGLHFPPWRKPEYMRAKWLAPYEREMRGTPSTVDLEEEKKSGDKLDEGNEEVTWQLPAVRPKASPIGTKVVTGLASVLRERP